MLYYAGEVRFDERAKHEDEHWWAGNNEIVVAADGMIPGVMLAPRMVCQIHGANTSDGYNSKAMTASEWTRAPQYDAFCEKVMAL